MNREDLEQLICLIAKSGVDILHWVPTSGTFPGIKLATRSSWYPPSEFSVEGINFVRWIPRMLSKQLVVGRIGKQLRDEALLKPLLEEAIENIGLRTDNLTVRLMKKKTSNGVVGTPFVSILGLDEDVMTHLTRRGFITLNYRAHPVRFFVPKSTN